MSRQWPPESKVLPDKKISSPISRPIYSVTLCKSAASSDPGHMDITVQCACTAGAKVLFHQDSGEWGKLNAIYIDTEKHTADAEVSFESVHSDSDEWGKYTAAMYIHTESAQSRR